MDNVQRDRERGAEELRVRMAELRKMTECEMRVKKELEVRHHICAHAESSRPYDINVHEGLTVGLHRKA